MSRLYLGCIADDFTGATDLANNLVRAGMRVVQTIGVPNTPLDQSVDAVVVALKSRTIAAEDAVAESLDALHWLQSQEAEQIYFKYCSTFDSTPAGNIGPVTEALMDALGSDFTIATPAFPDNGRTVFKGHLFVGEVLLHESGMQNHPLTPMTDPNLVRVLQAQCRRRVGLIDHRCVAAGEDAIRARIDALRAEGVGIAIVDAVSNADLLRLGPAIRDLRLLTAGSGVAIALPANHGLVPSPQASALPAPGGSKAVLAGSCSQATRAQVADFIAQGHPAHALPVETLVSQPERHGEIVANALAWAEQALAQGPVLVYSTADPDAVKSVQGRVGVTQAGSAVEAALADIALGLARLGVRQMVVAGGETSGACVNALGIRQMQIGPQIDPGVPWCHAQSSVGPLHLTLKSGNFGSVDFFRKAFDQLQPSVSAV
ncbi:MAG: four-carbon acid sugar kinase family protein [Limnohabitans sp.]|nr:four-carbon acid sugar kinase family protein [Limnohabitans sp.]